MAAPSIKNFKPQPKLPVNNFQKIVDGITQNSPLAVGMAAARPLPPVQPRADLRLVKAGLPVVNFNHELLRQIEI
jgi:hypothetical protein